VKLAFVTFLSELLGKTEYHGSTAIPACQSDVEFPVSVSPKYPNRC
jgi:hypothetical protein